VGEILLDAAQILFGLTIILLCRWYGRYHVNSNQRLKFPSLINERVTFLVIVTLAIIIGAIFAGVGLIELFVHL
jgi:hypothetical protein